MHAGWGGRRRVGQNRLSRSASIRNCWRSSATSPRAAGSRTKPSFTSSWRQPFAAPRNGHAAWLRPGSIASQDGAVGDLSGFHGNAARSPLPSRGGAPRGRCSPCLSLPSSEAPSRGSARGLSPLSPESSRLVPQPGPLRPERAWSGGDPRNALSSPVAGRDPASRHVPNFSRQAPPGRIEQTTFGRRGWKSRERVGRQERGHGKATRLMELPLPALPTHKWNPRLPSGCPKRCTGVWNGPQRALDSGVSDLGSRHREYLLAYFRRRG